MDEHQLFDNISKLLERVRRSSQKSHIGNSDILVLAVSKTRSAEEIRAVHDCGLTHFGENYLQEAEGKIAALSDLPLCWHFIGPIQSNKTRAIAEQFDWVHSVDREKIARRLSDQRPQQLAPLNICLQVNVSSEDSKAGVAMHELPALSAAISGLPKLNLRGLMCIPAPTEIEAEQRANFKQMRGCLQALQADHPSMDTLSMGMSADFESAIFEGATIVRLGTAIFGPRNR